MRFFSFGPKILSAVLVAGLFIASIGTGYAGSFSSLAGSWIGSGTFVMSRVRERVRCQAIYFVSGRRGEHLQQILRCAGGGYIITVNSDMTEIGGRMSGTWHESTSGVAGTLNGTVSGSVIRGTVSSLGYTALLSLITHGRSQYASIRLEAASAAVTVIFHRG